MLVEMVSDVECSRGTQGQHQERRLERLPHILQAAAPGARADNTWLNPVRGSADEQAGHPDSTAWSGWGTSWGRQGRGGWGGRELRLQATEPPAWASDQARPGGSSLTRLLAARDRGPAWSAFCRPRLLGDTSAQAGV